MRYRFPYVGADLRVKLVLSQTPSHTTRVQDHGYGLVYHAMCLFTRWVLIIAPTTEGWLRLSRHMGAWFGAEVAYPS